MTGIIPQNIIDQVRQSSDIVQVIGEFIRLKKRGRNFLALCPFHVEKTPSFSVSPDKQIYHCFGCGQGGNVFTFLMQHENMSFVEAVKHLADKAGIRVPEKRVDDGYKEELDRLYYAHQLALEYYRQVLKSARYKNQIIKYLRESRRLTEKSIEFFQLGLSGEEWDGFLNHALKKGLFPKDLAKAGLVTYSERKDSYYDRFRQRLMIPIFNLSGKPIAFGGRTLKKGESAKYINSPETPLYSKSNVLYGLNFSRQFIREKNEVIIVEGYFDLISLYQAGIKNVVASSGTAFTEQQARLLIRFADMAYLFFDSDSAGQTAAMRSVDALYDVGMEVMVMIPPEGEDPDSIAVKHGAEGIEEIKDQALRYLEFRVKDIDPRKKGIIEKEKLIKELAELGRKIGDTTRRRLFINEAAEALMLDVSHFYDLIPMLDRESSVSTDIGTSSDERTYSFEYDLLSLLVNYPGHMDKVQKKITTDDFQKKELASVFAMMIEMFKIQGIVSLDGLIDFASDPGMASLIAKIGQKEWDQAVAGQLIDDYIKKIIILRKKKIIEKLKNELKIAEVKGNQKAARKLTEEINALIKEINE